MARRGWRDVRIVTRGTRTSVREVHKWDGKHYRESYSLEEYKTLMIEGHKQSKRADGKFACRYCGKLKQWARLNSHRYKGCDEHKAPDGTFITLKLYPNLLTDRTVEDMETGRNVVDVVREYNETNPKPPDDEEAHDVAAVQRRQENPTQGRGQGQLTGSDRSRRVRRREDGTPNRILQREPKLPRKNPVGDPEVGSSRSRARPPMTAVGTRGSSTTTSTRGMESFDSDTTLTNSPSTASRIGLGNARRQGLLTNTGAARTTPAGTPPATLAGPGPFDHASSPTTAFREERRLAEARFRAQAAVEEPSPTTVSAPSQKVAKTALAWLIDSGLLSTRVADWDGDTLSAEFSTFVAGPERAPVTTSTFGRFMLQYHTIQVCTRCLSMLRPSYHYHPPIHPFRWFRAVLFEPPLTPSVSSCFPAEHKNGMPR